MATRTEKAKTASTVEKHLTFELAGEVYGIEILRIREIIGVMTITPIPNSPYGVKGVINLRGKIVPVVDLRVKFGMPETAYTERTCVIVIDRAGGKLTGLIVDAVSEVAQIPAAEIEPPPAMGDGLDTSSLRGVAKLKEKVVLLLDIGKVLGDLDAEVEAEVEAG